MHSLEARVRHAGRSRSQNRVRAIPLEPIGTLRCESCGQVKDAQLHFYARGDGKAHGSCIVCHNKHVREKKKGTTLNALERLIALASAAFCAPEEG